MNKLVIALIAIGCALPFVLHYSDFSFNSPVNTHLDEHDREIDYGKYRLLTQRDLLIIKIELMKELISVQKSKG